MQKKYKVTVGNNGRLVLPYKLREDLHIKSGDQVLLVLDQELKIIPLKESFKQIQQLVKSYNTNNISLVDSLKTTRTQEKDE